MKRRTLLRTVGGAVGAGALAGCLADDGAAPGGGGSDPDGTDPADPTATDDPTTDRPDDRSTTEDGTGRARTTTNEQSQFDTDADEPFDSITVGSRDGVQNPDDNRPHGVNIWNAAEDGRTLTIAVQRGSATVLEEEITFPGDGYLSMTLAEPGNYRIPIRADGDELGVVTVDRGRFDCNSSATNVDVTPDGEIRSTVISTMVACRTTGDSDPTFESAEGTCASGTTGDGRASVSFDDGVSIDGTILAPNPCHRATLVGVDETDGSMTVTVGIEDAREEGTVCMECVGSVGYSATFDEGFVLPEQVTVVHRNHRGEETVTTAES